MKGRAIAMIILFIFALFFIWTGIYGLAAILGVIIILLPPYKKLRKKKTEE